MRILITIVTILLVFRADVLFAQKADGKSEELSRIRLEIATFKQQLQENSDREKSLIENLEELDYEISLHANLKKELEIKINTLALQTQSITDHLPILAQELVQLRKAFRARAVTMYQYARSRSKFDFLTAGSFQNLPTLLKYYKILTELDKRRIADIGQKSAQANRLTLDFKKDLEDQSRLLDEEKQEKQILQRKKAERQRLLAAVREDKGTVKTALAARQNAEQIILSEINTILEIGRSISRARRMPESGRFSLAKGKLPLPVEGRITSHVGIEKDTAKKTQTINHGIEIVSEADADVMAVYTGKIAQVKWLPWFGQTVFIQHSEGYYTVYARLSDIAVNPGETVSTRQVIAKVGKETSTSASMLHFQIWQGSKTLDPEDWFLAAYGNNSGFE
jgi:septal ring factor EnvC (AmiA/AmiB activator)